MQSSSVSPLWLFSALTLHCVQFLCIDLSHRSSGASLAGFRSSNDINAPSVMRVSPMTTGIFPRRAGRIVSTRVSEDGNVSAVYLTLRPHRLTIYFLQEEKQQQRLHYRRCVRDLSRDVRSGFPAALRNVLAVLATQRIAQMVRVDVHHLSSVMAEGAESPPHVI